jgi:flagellin
MTVINTNTGSLYAQQSLNTNARSLAAVMQQLSTGKRINNAVDDVAGLAISTRLTSQIKGLNQAVRNANDAISLIQTAEGSTEQITNMLQRMRELAVQAANDTNNDKDRGFLNGEFQQLRSELDRIGQNTQWNGANILDGTGGNQQNGAFAFQIGANSRQTISISLPNLQTGIADPVMAAGGSSAMTATTTAATMSFATVDTTIAAAGHSAAEYLGVTFEASIGGKKVQYEVSQANVDAVTGANGTTVQALSVTIAQGIEAKLKSALGAGWTFDDSTAVTGNATSAATAGTLVATAPTSAPLVVADTKISVVQGDLSAIGGAGTDITSAANASKGLAAIDSALQTVSDKRAMMGATISRLQFAADNLSNVSAKATESRSRIEDTDYATATTELAKRNIIQQAAQAMLAQANQAPQMVLQLLK